MKNAEWENWTTLGLGVWLFLSPWIIGHDLSVSESVMIDWNAWCVGGVVSIAALLALQDLKPWEEWVNIALGVWLMLSPWIIGYSTEPYLLWNSLAVGFFVTLLSGISLPAAMNRKREY